MSNDKLYNGWNDSKSRSSGVPSMEDKVKSDIAQILRDNITYSPQVDGLVIHGAIEKIIEYFGKIPAKDGLRVKVQYPEHGKIILTNERGDTYTSKSEELIDFFLAAQPVAEDYQFRVNDWMKVCFGEIISADVTERNHRFIEEALELVQATGATKSECNQLVDYVFNRDIGEINQEIGGVMVTLAALCNAIGLNMCNAGETELKRVWTKVDKIREKQATKPKHSPLPASTIPSGSDADGLTIEDYKEVIEDHKRLVRELDEIINGKEGMAKQASLCDIVAQLRGRFSSGIEAVDKFIEWIDENEIPRENGMWIKYFDGTDNYLTTKELYQLFTDKNKSK